MDELQSLRTVDPVRNDRLLRKCASPLFEELFAQLVSGKIDDGRPRPSARDRSGPDRTPSSYRRRRPVIGGAVVAAAAVARSPTHRGSAFTCGELGRGMQDQSCRPVPGDVDELRDPVVHVPIRSGAHHHDSRSEVRACLRSRQRHGHRSSSQLREPEPIPDLGYRLRLAARTPRRLARWHTRATTAPPPHRAPCHVIGHTPRSAQYGERQPSPPQRMFRDHRSDEVSNCRDRDVPVGGTQNEHP